MEISLTTPALLFPAVSLLMLAYTNRFLGLAALVRSLHEKYKQTHDQVIIHEIASLRLRLFLIRNMQAFGALSILLCVVCMFLLFNERAVAGKWVFGSSLILFMASLALSLWEIWISVHALNLHLKDLESLK